MIFLKNIRQAFLLALVLLILCGVVYPYLLTGISHVLAPEKAGGSLIMVNDKAVGSALIGQDFNDPRFMKCRPSAVNYNTYTAAEKANGSYEGVSSGSQNLAPSNPKLHERVKEDMEIFLANHPNVQRKDIPTDIMTASGSGLDPHISPASAMLQIPALAQHTGLSEEQLKQIVREQTSGKIAGIFGEETVNVLKVNLEIAKAIGLIKAG